jgi:hypothetical protein
MWQFKVMHTEAQAHCCYYFVIYIFFTLSLLYLKLKGLNVADTPLPHTSASWLSVNEEALFALAYSTGPILLIRMNPLSGMVAVNELKQETMVPRFLSGIAGAFR